MWLALLGVVAGLALLTYASDQFVVGAARIAALLRWSPVVIGALVIGFGTSAPELLVSGLAAGQGSLEIAAGNVIGSNVANLSLVLGTAALLAPLGVRSSVLRREAPISLVSVVLFAVLIQGGLSRLEGVVLLVALTAGLVTIVMLARADDPVLTAEVDELLAEVDRPTPGREAVRVLLGLLGTLAGAQLLVTAARSIASELGLAEGFVGLSIVAIGTSLPELATAVQASRKHETDLIVGNLLGSNLFNSAAVAGVAGVVGPGALAAGRLTSLAVVAMVVVAVAATAMMVTGRRVARAEGAVLLVGYLAVLPFLAE